MRSHASDRTATYTFQVEGKNRFSNRSVKDNISFIKFKLKLTGQRRKDKMHEGDSYCEFIDTYISIKS